MTVVALLSTILSLFSLVLFARAILSWIPNKNGALASFESFTVAVTEPVVGPVRRMLPPMQGFDLSFIVVFIGIMIIRSFLRG